MNVTLEMRRTSTRRAGSSTRKGHGSSSAIRTTNLSGNFPAEHAGCAVVVLVHEPQIVDKVLGKPLPPDKDPLRRVRAWQASADLVSAARTRLLAEGKPVFIIGAPYGITSQIAFHLPEARAFVGTAPLVFHLSSDQPKNQFFFWPGYETRKGENAIFVRELDRKDPEPRPLARAFRKEFESVTAMGVTNVMYHGQLLRPLQIFACRALR